MAHSESLQGRGTAGGGLARVGGTSDGRRGRATNSVSRNHGRTRKRGRAKEFRGGSGDVRKNGLFAVFMLKER